MKLTVCLVAYSKEFTQTESFKRLDNLSSSIKRSLNLIVFDNGRREVTEYKIPEGFSSVSYYFNNEMIERGTRIAYQYAFDNMTDSWLMLLDDDTAITDNYILKVLKEISNTQVDALCPLIFDGQVQLSPTDSDTVKSLNFPKESGIYSKNITGISSGLVLSKQFMLEIGGFTREFPLDYLDHWVFWQLRDRKKKIKVIDEIVQHQLSVQRLTELSENRFYSIFSSEYLFYKKYVPEALYQIRKKYVKMIIVGFLKKNQSIRWRVLLKIIFNRQ